MIFYDFAKLDSVARELDKSSVCQNISKTAIRGEVLWDYQASLFLIRSVNENSLNDQLRLITDWTPADAILPQGAHAHEMRLQTGITVYTASNVVHVSFIDCCRAAFQRALHIVNLGSQSNSRSSFSLGKPEVPEVLNYL